jgi:hypothetical protein
MERDLARADAEAVKGDRHAVHVRVLRALRPELHPKSGCCVVCGSEFPNHTAACFFAVKA